MIYHLTADHSNPAGSRFEATVIKDGINYGQVTGFILYPIDQIVIHDPVQRKTHRLPINSYNNYHGNFIDFLTHILRVGSPPDDES